jgi:hypothetical protein
MPDYAAFIIDITLMIADAAAAIDATLMADAIDAAFSFIFAMLPAFIRFRRFAFILPLAFIITLSPAADYFAAILFH